jgi:glycosyltransferase involved in cell wall biosynthesis
MSAPAAGSSVLHVVIPVHDEEVGRAASVARVHRHLSRLPSSFRITVADSASTDGTALVARRLGHEYGEVRAVHPALRPGDRSRLTRGSRTRRGSRRELSSRGYNLLLRGTLRAVYSSERRVNGGCRISCEPARNSSAGRPRPTERRRPVGSTNPDVRVTLRWKLPASRR